MSILEAIALHREAGHIATQRHPRLPLLIHNYTQRCQFDQVWNDVTLACRGLITDESGNIIARPFRKFFNVEEHEREGSVLPPINWNQPFYVSEKLDGSLGILYWDRDIPCIASRGSFVSAQANCGTHLLHDLYSHCRFDRRFTYLFELISKNNRIVVDYGSRAALVLIAVIHTESGKELEVLPEIGFPIASTYGPYASQRGPAERYLPPRSTQDDSRKHYPYQPGMEDVPRVPPSGRESIQQETNEGKERRAKAVSEEMERSQPGASSTISQREVSLLEEEDRQDKKRSVHGLQPEISSVCDGLRSSSGRKEAVQHNSETWQPKLEVNRVRNGEMRCGLCELSSDSHIWGDAGKPVEAQGDVTEGVVVRFEDGLRVKIKLAEYKRLHKLITGINARKIWECLSAGTEIDLERVPDEFFRWVTETKESLLCEHHTIDVCARAIFAGITSKLGSGRPRKDYALEFLKHRDISALLFALLDAKDIGPLIWKAIYPAHSVPWKADEVAA